MFRGLFFILLQVTYNYATNKTNPKKGNSETNSNADSDNTNVIYLNGIITEDGKQIALMSRKSYFAIKKFELRKSKDDKDNNSWSTVKEINVYDNAPAVEINDKSYRVILEDIEDEEKFYTIKAEFEGGNDAYTQTFTKSKDGKFVLNGGEDSGKKGNNGKELSFNYKILVYIFAGIVIVGVLGYVAFSVFSKE